MLKFIFIFGQDGGAIGDIGDEGVGGGPGGDLVVGFEDTNIMS